MRASPRTQTTTLHDQNLHRMHGARDVQCQSGRLSISHVGLANQGYFCHRDRATNFRRQLYRHLTLVMLPDRAGREKYRPSGCLACAPDSLRCPFAPRPLDLSIQTFLDCEASIGARAGGAAHGQGAGIPSWRVRPRVGPCPAPSRCQHTFAVHARRLASTFATSPGCRIYLLEARGSRLERSYIVITVCWLRSWRAGESELTSSF